MRTGKVWTRKDADGQKYHRLLLDDGREEIIPFFEGLSAQWSLIALQDAVEAKLGEPCQLTIMDLLTAYDEADGLSEDQTRRVFDMLHRAPKADTEH
jgi:hypothetical protein